MARKEKQSPKTLPDEMKKLDDQELDKVVGGIQWEKYIGNLENKYDGPCESQKSKP